MREIALTKGQVALVDDEDFERVRLHSWRARWLPRARTFYAVRTAGPQRARRDVYMHREILSAESRLEIDHADLNGLNNTRANLRTATHSQNMANRRKPSNNTSGFKGVRWRPARGKWEAYIQMAGRYIYLGRFRAAREAADA